MALLEIKNLTVSFDTSVGLFHAVEGIDLSVDAREMLSRSWPSNVILSAVTVAVGGNRPITASISTDLPEPDSPTMARVLPFSTLSEASLTAWMVLARPSAVRTW